MPNVFNIANEILIEGFEEHSKDHDEMLGKSCQYADSRI